MKCSECLYSFELGTDAVDRRLQCRRYPPQIYAIVSGDGADISTDVFEDCPVIENDHWCGEFEPRPVGVN